MVEEHDKDSLGTVALIGSKVLRFKSLSSGLRLKSLYKVLGFYGSCLNDSKSFLLHFKYGKNP